MRRLQAKPTFQQSSKLPVLRLPLFQSTPLPSRRALDHTGLGFARRVLKEGDIFLVTLPGTVLVQALKEAEVEISALLKTKPYRGEYVFYP